jgi:ribosomal protein S12 methylthiotransferase accessory factor
MPRPARATRLDDLLSLVSPRVGLIRSLDRVPHGIGLPDPPVLYRAVLSHFDFRRASSAERSASGKGETEAEAMAGAIGEAVERYCASHPYPEHTVRSTFAALGDRAIDPASLVLYSEGQYAGEGFPFRRPGEQAVFTWMPAVSLPDRQEVLVPASFVYLNYPCERPEEYLADPTSNGLAAGPDLASAVLGGLLELVERDGFLIHWYNRLPAPRVDLSGLGGLFRSVPAHFHRSGVEVSAFNLTTDLAIPVMMAVATGPAGPGPAAAVGLGCDLDPAEALRRAVMEMCQSYLGEMNRMRREGGNARVRSPQDVREPEDHGTLFAREETLPELSFLLDGDRVQRLEDLPDRSTGRADGDLETCVGIVTRAGHRVAYADVTTPDLLPTGLRVVRVLAGGLQPMHFGTYYERRGGRRLYEVPVALGYAARPRTEPELNPFPHPLA